jgi:voltage-gated potassium channel
VTAAELTEGSRRDRLRRYEARTDRPLLLLAAAFVVVYAVQVVAAPGLPSAAHKLLDAASWLIWAVFAGDLAARVWLADAKPR